MDEILELLADRMTRAIDEAEMARFATAYLPAWPPASDADLTFPMPEGQAYEVVPAPTCWSSRSPAEPVDYEKLGDITRRFREEMWRRLEAMTARKCVEAMTARDAFAANYEPFSLLGYEEESPRRMPIYAYRDPGFSVLNPVAFCWVTGIDCGPDAAPTTDPDLIRWAEEAGCDV